MARRKNTWWTRIKYKLSALVLVLAAYFTYQAFQFPEFPPAWEARTVGPVTIKLQPMNDEPPYTHHDDHVKDFMAFVPEGSVGDIRQAYLNIAPQAKPLAELQSDDVGIMHGSELLQHAHAIAPDRFAADDKVWLTVQTWQGKIHTTSWKLPERWIK